MHQEGQASAGEAPFGLDEAAGQHDNQDDANAEGGARRQGLDQTMHGCRRKGYWVSARIWGDWVECFHNRPSIPNPSTESYSNGKTRVIRSRIKSRSNSANTARKPAKARPAGVVRSRASVSETNPTPRAVSSCNVVIKSTRERPQRSSFQTRITSSWRCFAALSKA